MTGVIDEDTCPQCGNPHAYTEYQTRTFEDWLFCMRCGYEAGTRTLIDRKRSAADPEGRQSFKLRKDGRLIQRSYERRGHGVCCLRSPDGIGTVLRNGRPLKPNRQDEIAAAIRSGKWGERELDPDASYLTVWDEPTATVQVLAGSLPAN
ncbi:MAG: hypothetical protein FJZ97_07930 [Chloroflexi bacterium]|nr:hypothetical protein [Chloroflexota bacterium]